MSGESHEARPRKEHRKKHSQHLGRKNVVDGNIQHKSTRSDQRWFKGLHMAWRLFWVGFKPKTDALDHFQSSPDLYIFYKGGDGGVVAPAIVLFSL